MRRPSRRLTLPSLTFGLVFLFAGTSRAGVGSSLLNFTLPGTGAEVGTAVAVAGDVNGDGYSDLIVGAPHYSIGQEEQGQVLLFLGGPNGYATTAAWTYVSNVTGANLGRSVAPAGDVNGDGYADVIVGAPNFSSSGLTNNGRAYVFLGGPSGLASTPAWTFDGTQGGEMLGWSVCTAGDVNGDGFDDVVIGSPNYGNITAPRYGEHSTTTTGFNNGRALAFLGSATGPATSPSWVHSGFQYGGAFGFSVSTAGDVNGDGYDDVVIGAPYGTDILTTGDHEAGEIDVFHGGPGGLPSTPSVVRYGSQVNELCGYSVATAGDVDGDGYADIVVGAPGHTNIATSQGAVYVYPGSSEGIQGAAFRDEGPVANAALPGGQLGYCVAPAGDINGDGYADFVAGAPFYSLNGFSAIYIGYVAVYEGTPRSNGQFNGYHARLAYSSSDGHGSELGAAVCAAGDANADGFGDVVVGAPTAVGSDGRVLVLGGTADAPSSVVGQSIDYPPSKLDVTGSRPLVPISGGDIDGDGYTDLLVFVNGSDLTEIFRGGPGGLATSPAWTIHASDVDATTTGGFLVGVGDVNGDGYDDLGIVVAKGEGGVGYVLAGSSTGPVLPPIAALGSLARLCPIGDVNGDGYADLVGLPVATLDTLGDSAKVYFGRPGGPSPVPSQTLIVHYSGLLAPLQTLGDYDGDGFGDMLIYDQVYTGTLNEQGRIQVFTGSASGLNTTPVLTILGSAVSDHLFPKPTGDLTGDGLADFALIGASTPLTFYYGNGALSPTVVSAAPHALGLPSGGDVTDDGLEDFVYTPLFSSNGPVGLYLGSSAGMSTSPSSTLSYAQYPWEYSTMRSGYWGVADFNGDGFGDAVNVAQGFSALDVTDTCHVQIVYGNEDLAGAPGLDRAPTQRRASDAARIGLLGISDSPTQFRLACRGRSAAGRTRVRMESEVKDGGAPFDSNLGNLIHDSWSATGSPGASGTFVALDAVRGLPSAGTTDKWRMRIAAHSPYFPWTPWLSPPGNGRNEYDLRRASSAVSVPLAGHLPSHLELAPPSPNPSHGEMQLTFVLPRPSTVELDIYDLGGRHVATLARGAVGAGPHDITWSGRADSGRMTKPGMYLERLVTEGQQMTRKIVRTE